MRERVSLSPRLSTFPRADALAPADTVQPRPLNPRATDDNGYGGAARYRRVSAHDAALSIRFWALLQSVPTSSAITTAAAAARVAITASAMPYSARS